MNDPLCTGISPPRLFQEPAEKRRGPSDTGVKTHRLLLSCMPILAHRQKPDRNPTGPTRVRPKAFVLIPDAREGGKRPSHGKISRKTFSPYRRTSFQPARRRHHRLVQTLPASDVVRLKGRWALRFQP